MGTDISRIRHDPLKDFGGVVLQQGRLLLDADFNEFVAMVDRRLRAETMDLTSFGPDPDEAGVAWVPRLTPDAFRVTAAAGSFTIGRGRMYVDGLLAENHGLAPLGFDELLSEPTGTADVPYDQQPYWPTPDPLPGQGPHLAYLDVWEREVTHVEDPDLLETAVGVDTTGRRQIVWQVRVLPDVGSGACDADDDDIPGWLDVIRPSAGRLSTDTVEVDPDVDPCELPPSGGYRGVENQTYRIEVHDGGAPGTATFKWSRDNASVTVPVVEMISTTSLRVGTLGRDDVLRISTDDWVEILDDHREFNQQPGVLRKVTVDDATRTITFTDALPADLQPVDDDDAAARHLRIRRWDQSGEVVDADGNPLADLDAAGATGLIDVPSTSSTQVVLEHGIVVSFSVATTGGEFRSGDHWVVAARTADTSVETLTEAPPRGIHHHYARLGTLTFPATQTDCRTHWPPIATGGESCDCTLCVSPESHASGALTLQDAVDLIGSTGGTICLSPGLYDLGQGVTIDGARGLRIRGQGLATILGSQGPALTVVNSFGVTIENLAAVVGAQASAAVSLRNVVDASVQDTALIAFGTNDTASAAIELSGAALIVALRRNVLVGRVGVDGAGGGEIGVMAADLSVEDNVIAGVRGIDLGGRSLYLLSCRVDANEVVSIGTAVRASGATAPSGALAVTGNDLLCAGTGIEVGADALVSNNAIDDLPGGGGDAAAELGGGDGIVVAEGGLGAEPGDVQVLANRIHNRRRRGIALDIPVRTFMVKQNIVADAGAGIVVAAKGAAEHLAVANNVVSGIEPAASDDASTAYGIAVTNARFAELSTNTVSDVGSALVEGSVRAGLLVAACRDVRISGNIVHGVGPDSGFVGAAAGIGVVGPFERATITENSVSFGLDADAPTEGAWWALLVTSSTGGLVDLGARSVVRLDDSAIAFTESAAIVVGTAGDHATIATNTLTGGGRQPTCLVSTAGDVVADANQCSHLGGITAVLLRGGSVAAASNRVRGGEAMLVIDANEDRFSAVGNLASGGTHLGGPGASLPAPWDALNPIVS
jgi:hypothetical protein